MRWEKEKERRWRWEEEKWWRWEKDKISECLFSPRLDPVGQTQIQSHLCSVTRVHLVFHISTFNVWNAPWCQFPSTLSSDTQRPHTSVTFMITHSLKQPPLIKQAVLSNVNICCYSIRGTLPAPPSIDRQKLYIYLFTSSEVTGPGLSGRDQGSNRTGPWKHSF